jgi:hypothetical protein
MLQTTGTFAGSLSLRMTPAQADQYTVQRNCHTLTRSYPVSAGAHRKQLGSSSYYARRLAQAVDEFSQASRSMQTYELQKQLKLDGTGINIGERGGISNLWLVSCAAAAAAAAISKCRKGARS